MKAAPFRILPAILAAVLSCMGLAHLKSQAEAVAPYFEIQVQDEATGRGIPLVQLTTVNHVTYVTDNAGRVAYYEPGQMGQTVFFEVKAHGFEVPKDGFGIAGTRFKMEPNGSGVLKLKRVNLAERLYRITGCGLYRDSVLLGKETPLAEPLGSGMVAGQDSVFAVPYRDRVYWFWGDTNRMSYPLGLFRMAGATSELPGKSALPVDKGINFKYFTGADGFARAMVEVENPEGVVWIFGVHTVRDAEGKERMVGHFTRRKGLGEEYEQGIVVYNDEREIFEVKSRLPLTERWRFLSGQPVKVQRDGVEYLYSGLPFPQVRVPATLEAVLDPTKYEAFSVAPAGEAEQSPNDTSVVAGEARHPQWRWTTQHPPTVPKQEALLIKQGAIVAKEARFLPEDADHAGQRVELHTGSVKWNTHRKKWVMIAVETAYQRAGSPSPLGEVWYSEADAPEGPFLKAVCIVTHDKQTFYNPVHHEFMDEDGGRTIYFEGTYTNQFVNSPPTPLYEYNQIMYRLDLDHPRLKAAFVR